MVISNGGYADAMPSRVGRSCAAAAVRCFGEDTPPEGEPDDLLGLYDGVALTERQANHAFELPDRIFVFRLPLLDMCESVDELVEEVEITVVHEIAHHFGIAEERLHELGWV